MWRTTGISPQWSLHCGGRVGLSVNAAPHHLGTHVNTCPRVRICTHFSTYAHTFPHTPQDDILKVVVDLPAEQQQRAAQGQARLAPEDFNTGQFECIMGGGSEVRAPVFMGLNLELKVSGRGIVWVKRNNSVWLWASTWNSR